MMNWDARIASGTQLPVWFALVVETLFPEGNRQSISFFCNFVVTNYRCLQDSPGENLVRVWYGSCTIEYSYSLAILSVSIHARDLPLVSRCLYRALVWLAWLVITVHWWTAFHSWYLVLIIDTMTGVCAWLPVCDILELSRWRAVWADIKF